MPQGAALVGPGEEKELSPLAELVIVEELDGATDEKGRERSGRD